MSQDPVEFYNAQVIYKNLKIEGFGVRGFLQTQTEEQKTEMIETLIEEIGKSSFSLPVGESFSLKQFQKALAANEQPGRNGKILFKNSP